MENTEAWLNRIGARLEFLRSNFDQITSDQDLHHRFEIKPPCSDAELTEVEQRLGIALPEEYRSFLRRFGNTKAGPGLFSTLHEAITDNAGNPFPLKAPMLGVMSVEHQSMTIDQQSCDYSKLLSEYYKIDKNEGVLNLANYGCGIYAKLVLEGKYRGQIWIDYSDVAGYSPFGGTEEQHEVVVESWVPTNAPREYNFLEWYGHWLLNLKCL